MTRYQRYQREKFKDWKRRVAAHLPQITADFYRIGFDRYESHVMLGRVITYINDPYYSICDQDRKPVDYMTEMSDQIILEIAVCTLFRLVNKRK